MIIVSKNDVSFIDGNNPYLGSIGEMMPRDNFEVKFGLSLEGVDTLAYEPERNLFHIERYGRVDVFQNANDNALMKTIASKEEAVRNYFELLCLDRIKPSKYHTLVNKAWTISNEDKVKLDRDVFEANFRKDRDALLVEADILINKAVDLGQDTTALRAYRQALRDATVSWVMPTKP
jgi:hypothetical protein